MPALFAPSRLLALTLALAALGAGLSTAQAHAADVTVMTRNVYFGTDPVPLAVEPPGERFETAATNVFQRTIDSHPRERMKAIAAEIAKARPDVVGLQEVGLYRTGPKGDPAAATKVVYDMLADLTSALRRLKAPYRVVGPGEGFDAEGPTSRGFDLRITIDDSVTLVRRGVSVRNVRARAFRNQFVIPTQALGEVEVTRGFTQFDGTVDGRRIRFVNTHLEAYSNEFKAKQGTEIVRGPARSRLPTIVIGDLNTGPNLEDPADEKPFQVFSRAGFKISRLSRSSCCFEGDVRTGRLDHNVDWILTKPKARLLRSYITGARKIGGVGVYPADHAGVVSELRVR